MAKNRLTTAEVVKQLSIKQMEKELWDLIEYFNTECPIEERAEVYKRMDVLQDQYSKVCL